MLTELRFCSENYLHIAVQVLSLISTLAQLAGIICHIIKECHQRHPHLVHWVAAFFSIAGKPILHRSIHKIY